MALRTLLKKTIKKMKFYLHIYTGMYYEILVKKHLKEALREGAILLLYVCKIALVKIILDCPAGIISSKSSLQYFCVSDKSSDIVYLFIKSSDSPAKYQHSISLITRIFINLMLMI